MVSKVLKGGHVLMVSDEDADLLQLYWGVGSGGYVCRNKRCGSKRRVERIHRTVLVRMMGDAGLSAIPDHVNRNRLDNRRENLRPASPDMSNANRGKWTRRTCLSKYKGVTLDRRIGRWHAQIGGGPTRVYLGSFGSEEDAARAYDRAATERYGAFAAVNFTGVLPTQQGDQHG